MSINLLVAPLDKLTARQVHGIYKLRVDVFVHAQATPFAEIDDLDADPQTLHLVAADGDEVVGTARLYPSLIDGREVVQFGRFALAGRVRGTGLGRTIMQTMLARAAENYPSRAVYLTAQVPLTGYYAGFGFTPVGEIFDDTGMPHQPMLREPSA